MQCNGLRSPIAIFEIWNTLHFSATFLKVLSFIQHEIKGVQPFEINRLYLYATKYRGNSKSPIFLRLAPLNTFRERAPLQSEFLIFFSKF